MVASAGTLAAAPPLAVANAGGCSTTVITTASAITGPPTILPANPQGTGTTTNGEVGPTRTRNGENRRSNKPIMEKRRRARINNCLNELKTLILDAMKKDPARHSKLEKADILEMTVKHLETLQRQQVAMAAATDPNVANKFRAGFTECAGEVGRFPGLEGSVKRRLLQHLANCLNNASSPQQTTQQGATPAQAETTTTTTTTTSHPVQVHILRTPDSNVIQGLQLVPTRLPNGDIALILPTARATTVSSSPSSPSPSLSSSSSGSSPLPMLVPIPNRTSVNSPSPVAFDRLSLANCQPVRPVAMATTPSPQPPPPVISDPEDRRLVINEDYVDNSPSPSMHSSNLVRNHDVDERLVISDEYESVDYSKSNYSDDRETLLHIPEREYYDSYEDSESEYYSHQMPMAYSPEMQAPLELVTRKRCEEREEQPWRPW